MGARGKKRVRADGSKADGRALDANPHAALAIDWATTTMDPVPPALLARAVIAHARVLPISRKVYEDMEERHEDFDDFYRWIEDDIGKLSDDPRQVEALNWRSSRLIDLLRNEEGRYWSEGDGDNSVVVDPALLRHAASAPIDDHPTSAFDWMPSEKRAPRFE